MDEAGALEQWIGRRRSAWEKRMRLALTATATSMLLVVLLYFDVLDLYSWNIDYFQFGQSLRGLPPAMELLVLAAYFHIAVIAPVILLIFIRSGLLAILPGREVAVAFRIGEMYRAVRSAAWRTAGWIVLKCFLFFLLFDGFVLGVAVLVLGFYAGYPRAGADKSQLALVPLTIIQQWLLLAAVISLLIYFIVHLRWRTALPLIGVIALYFAAQALFVSAVQYLAHPNGAWQLQAWIRLKLNIGRPHYYETITFLLLILSILFFIAILLALLYAMRKPPKGFLGFWE